METDPVSEMSCFSSNYLESGRRTKSENPVILCVIHHRQNGIESTSGVLDILRAEIVCYLNTVSTDHDISVSQFIEGFESDCHPNMLKKTLVCFVPNHATFFDHKAIS
jgi:hypothetical protein